MILQSIERWFLDFRKYFYYYRDGFFELPFVGNNPQTTIESAIRLPFKKYNAKQQKITTDNPFIKGEMHFEYLEPGFAITFLDMEFRANCNFKCVYDKYLPINYYLLIYQINQNEFPALPSYLNGHSYTLKTWEFYKPGFKHAYIFKGTHGLYFNIYMSEDWIKNNLAIDDEIAFKKIANFIRSGSNFITIPENNISELLYQPIVETFKAKGEQGVSNPGKLKQLTYDCVLTFLSKINTNDSYDSELEINDTDRKKIKEVERKLVENLFTAFPGIENLAQEIGMSETRLKSYFKTMFGNTLLQYFKKRQMELAKQLLASEKIKINELALRFGYESAGKFSNAFKNQFGVLPSEV